MQRDGGVCWGLVVLTEDRWREELDKFNATVSPTWSNGGDDGGCVCGEGGAHVWLRQSWGEGTRVRKWPGSGCVSDANRADVTAHIIWW